MGCTKTKFGGELMTGYFDEECKAELLIAQENLHSANLKLEEIEADLHNNPNFIAKAVLKLRKYQLTNIKLDAEAIIAEYEN